MLTMPKRNREALYEHPFLNPAIRDFLKMPPKLFAKQSPKLWWAIAKDCSLPDTDEDLEIQHIRMCRQHLGEAITALIHKEDPKMLHVYFHNALKVDKAIWNCNWELKVVAQTVKWAPQSVYSALWIWLFDFTRQPGWNDILRICWNPKFEKHNGCGTIWFRMEGEQPEQIHYCSASCEKTQRNKRSISKKLLVSD